MSPSLGLAEAAKHCGVSTATIRRKKPALVEYGATTDATGWKIPYSALIAVGLAPSVTPPAEPVTPAVEPSVSPTADLERQLAQALARAEKAEAVLFERERIIEVQAQALRMLEPAPSKTPLLASKRWWNRK